jgi:2-dehydro-3-deoxygalactonokinase
MMRGEEVESIAMLAMLESNSDYIFVLPGSHTKFIAVNPQGELTACLSTLSGELLEAVTNHTIIADAVGQRFYPDSYNKELLLQGYDDACQLGLSRALFQVRIMSILAGKSAEDASNYLLGAVLSGDIQAAQHSSILHLQNDTAIVIAGKAPFLQALTDLFIHAGFKNVQKFSSVEDLAGYGAIEVWLAQASQRIMA